MPWLIGTPTQVRAALSRIATRLGYPRAPLESDRYGGGIHVPLAQAPTTSRWAYLARLSDGRAACRIKARIVPHLTPTMQALVVSDLPDGVTVVREDED